MLKRVVPILGIFLALSMPVASAKEAPTQISEATTFFNQVMQQTDNPLIANLAKESLLKLQTPSRTASVPAAAGSILPARHQTVVPTLRQMQNSIAVPVLVNRATTATFVVDTGATYTVITPAFAQRLGLQVSPSSPRLRIATANGSISAPILNVPRMSVGDIEVSNVQVVVQDLGGDGSLNGLLGMNFFRNLDLTIQPNRIVLSISQAF